MVSQLKSVIIESLGYYLPENVVTNDDLAKRMDTSDEWIRTRTGIRERRIAEASQATSDLAVKACLAAFEKANIDKNTIDLLIVATMSPDMAFPATATLLQAKLVLKNIMAFDISAACSGFLYAMEVGRQMMLQGNYRRALIVGAEKMSSVLDWQDRATSVLFGDGAGAAILKRIDEPNYGLLGSVIGADGQQAELLCMPAGGSRFPINSEAIQNRQNFLKMNGKELFKFAVRWMEKAVLDLLEQHALELHQISCIVPHQANMRILEALAERLRLPIEKFYINIDRFANTSAASIPIALAEAVEKGCILPDQYVVLAAFGAGLTWSTSLLKYPPSSVLK